MNNTFCRTTAGATSCSAVGRETTQKSRVSTRKTTGVGKNKRRYLFLFIGLCCLALQSCAPYYYQVYKVKPAANVKQSGNSLVYEDVNCKVLYDFWSEGGDVGFMIYNKTDKDIFVNMKESFFICNGIAYDYFKNREFTSSQGTSQSSMYSYSATNTYSAMVSIIGDIAVSGYNYQGFKQTNSVAAGLSAKKSVSSGASSGKSVSKFSSSGVNVKEKDIVCIPPKSAKVISEYTITKNLYRDCNLFLKPAKNHVNTIFFSEKTSPFVFSNRITYTVDGQSVPVKINQNFYISEITNYTEKEIIEKSYRKKKCEEEKKSLQTEKYFKDTAPDKFYIRYIVRETSKH